MTSNPRRNYTFYLHRDHLGQSVDIAKTVGLEIGAMDLPFVEPGEGACDFADFRTTEEVCDLASRTKGHNPEFVVPVAYNLRVGYDVITATYDWVAAGHVIEHVPDIIGWFDVLHSKLRDRGIVFLVVPDKRFTFDYHRTVTILSDVVAAHQEKLRTPSFKQVFDHYYYTTEQIDPGQIWKGVQVGPAARNYAVALGRAENAVTSYEDAHCSVFTPESFNELMNDLTATGLLRFRLESLRPTPLNQLDFTAVFRRL